MSARIDMLGQRFGRLIVVGLVPYQQKTGTSTNAVWKCSCDCGGTTTTLGLRLRSGKTQSCGCRVKDTNAARLTTHGFSPSSRAAGRVPGHPLYETWSSMRKRCNCVSCKEYPRYGGRGIKICERWQSSFEAFVEDVGSKPSPVHSLDRIDNNGNYEPGNVRWATPKEQENNKRNSVFLTLAGRTRTVAQWSEELGLNRITLHYRLRRGWSVDRALTTPTRKLNLNRGC